MMPEETHPYWVVAELLKKYPSVEKLWFSHYVYTPQSISDERINFAVPRATFLSNDWISSALSKTPASKELAIHSNVICSDGSEMHIPMADMSTGAKAHLVKLQDLLHHTGFGVFDWFSSGRSFHGYGDRLINSEDWRRLMGVLLLSNQRGMMPTVDPRWIGHRLMSGYSALRWTRNTSHYVSFPSKVL